MKGIGAAARNNVALAVGHAAVFRRIQGRVDAELLNRLGCKLDSQIGFLTLPQDAARIYAVEKNLVVVKPMARKANAYLVAAARVDGTGHQDHESGPVAAIDWQVFHLLLRDHAACRGAVLVQRDSRGFYGHRLLHHAHTQSQVHGSELADLQIDIVYVLRLKTCYSDADVAAAQGQG